MRVAAASLVVTAAVAVAIPAAPLPREAPRSKPTTATAKPVKLRVVEVSVFKDGHVLVREEGTAAPDRRGEVVLEGFRAPVYGGYLPYSASPEARLAGVIASVVTTPTSRQAAHLDELLATNAGSRVRIIETNGERYEGVIEGAPVAVSAEAARGGAPNRLLPGPSGLLLLNTTTGKRLVPLDHVRSLTVAGPFTRRIADTEPNGRLRMRLEAPFPARATLGAQYLQKGIRWISGYRVDLDGAGSARAHLQATIVNELADLVNTEVRLVIGVPRIFNAEETDPIALFKSPEALSRRFSPDPVSRMGGFGGGFGGGGFGGGGAGGTGGPGGVRCGEAAEQEPGAAEAEHEDLFYLPPRRLTLKRDETIVMPLREMKLDYADVYTVDIPFLPQEDAERARGLTPEQRLELAPQLLEVRAKHQIRLANRTDQPLTTGPAVIFRDGRLAAHSLFHYTPIGGTSLCLLGDAPEIRVTHEDREVKREEIPAPPNRRDYPYYTKFSLEGAVTLVNQSGRSVDVELTRSVAGNVDTAPDGEIVRLDRAENPAAATSHPGRPWVNRLTGSSRITWKVTLRPDETRTFPYTWHAYRS